jgi:DNA replication protein DnaC
MDVSDQTAQATCGRHGPYERRTIEVLGRKITRGCPQCAKEHADAEAARDLAMNREREDSRIRAIFERSAIPPRFQTRTFANYVADTPEKEKALRTTKRYADNWPTMLESGTCLVFVGKPGTGKTHLACAIANQIMEAGSSAFFVTVSDAMRGIKATYDKGATLSEADAIKALVDPKLLILDEVGADMGTEHSKVLLFDVINKRYEHVRPTIILTNLDQSTLSTYFGERILDRLREGGGKLVSFTWASHRA